MFLVRNEKNARLSGSSTCCSKSCWRPTGKPVASGHNLIEGNVIKRMAYGFCDDAYFFLKIRDAFPGVG
jgi:hypothetical protein